MTGADFKESDKGLNPFELLDDDKYKSQWIEYSKAMKGKRRLVWSNNMRSILGLNDELTDEEIAEAQEAIDENTQIRCKLSKKSWRYVVKNNLRVKLLEMSEVGGDEFKSWYFLNVLGPVYKSSPPGSQ